ncbi:MAG: VWA containing CoxE family protein [Proteobacteria bacterium]|nr:VWA containing CoxE family protein [Pseudomonadota bacterium]
MFSLLLHNLRSQGIKVGISEWLLFLSAMKKGLATHMHDLYGLGRTILCTSEAQFDAFDLAFTASFDGLELSENIADKLAEWLNKTIEMELGELVEPDIPLEDLWEEFYKRLKEQEEEHNGGSRWIGTGGTSPFGHSGRASHGIRVGGQSRNRSAVSIAEERRWAAYRVDTRLEMRDFQMALKALRKLAPDGEYELDVDKTIDKTSDNGGEIELVFSRQKSNRVRLVLLMDSGGSMEPHARLVESLFSAASELKGFRSFEAWHFHNAPYGLLFREEYGYERSSIEDLLRQWTPAHRVVWVGDACMAPYELLTPTWNSGKTGLEWIQRITRQCPKSVWLNPEPERYWNHATISRVAKNVSMFPFTLGGLRDAVRELRK